MANIDDVQYAKISEHVEYWDDYNEKIEELATDKPCRQIETSNKLSLYLASDEMQAIFKSKALVRGSKSLGIDDVVEIIKEYCDIIRFTNQPLDNLSLTELPELRIYDINKSAWLPDEVLIGNMINGVSKKVDINKVIDALKRDAQIPLISYTRDAIINQQFNKIERDGKYYFDITVDFKNGRYNTATRQLLPANRSTLAFDTLHFNFPTNYSDDAKKKYYELFDAYFQSASNNNPLVKGAEPVPNKDRELVMKQVALCALLNINPGEQIINLYGPAGTGKSTYLSLVNELAGGDKNVSSITYDQLSSDEMLNTVLGKRAIICKDNDDKIAIKALANVKRLASHETMTIKRKYKDALPLVFRGLILQAFNEPPKFLTGGSKQPILDRMILIELVNRFRGENSDNTDLAKQLTSPQTIGFMAMYLMETVEYFEEFHQSDNDTSRKSVVFDSDDPVADFVNNIYLNGGFENELVPMKHLKALYDDYARIESLTEYGAATFNSKVEALLPQYDLSINETKTRLSTLENACQYDYKLLEPSNSHKTFNDLIASSIEKPSSALINKSIYNANADKIPTYDDINESDEITNKRLFIRLICIARKKRLQLTPALSAKEEDEMTTSLNTELNHDAYALKTNYDLATDIDMMKHYCYDLLKLIDA